MNHKLLIIGSNGYIGSFLYRYITGLGFNVDGIGSRLDDYNLLDSNDLQAYSTIILLAGSPSVAACVGDLRAPWNNNVRNFHNLIGKLNDDQRVIYASSSSVYGKQNRKLYTEDDLCLEYLNNYDLTKINLDLVAKTHIQQGRKIVGLRFGTVNGGSPVLRKELMINSMVYSAINLRQITIANSYIHRPILHIHDLARAVIKIITGTWISGIYNLASFNSTVLEIAKTVSQITAADIIDQGNQGDPYDFRIDCQKFKDHYSCEFNTEVDHVVHDLLKWYSAGNFRPVERNQYLDYQG